MKKIAVLVILVLVLIITMGIAANEKVDVCHIKGNGDYNVITVSLNALQAHLNHGDALYVNGVCQWSYDPTPTPTPTPIPTVVFLTRYYIPIMFQFFDWDKYCTPRCPLGVDLSGNPYP